MSDSLTAILQYALSRGFQIHPDALEILRTTNATDMQRVIKEVVGAKMRQGEKTISGSDVAGALGISSADDPFVNEFRVISEPTGSTASAEGVEGFGALFASRYQKMRALMAGRAESKSMKTISAIKKDNKANGTYTCGLVWEYSQPSKTKSGRLVLEDPTGTLEVRIMYNEREGDSEEGFVVDQFVVARVSNTRGGLVANEISVPDIAMHTPNKSETETYAVLMSDLHVGSRYFMRNEFERFLSWLESDDIVAKRVGYVLLCGDVVDGVGIYANQTKELLQQTVEEQLALLDELVGRINSDIKVIIAPGNHDPGRRALPQPAIPREYAPALWERSNVKMVGNPAVVWLNGVRVLMYHGQSIDDIVRVTKLSYDRPLGVMKYLLRSRHLSPIYGGSTPTAPESEDLMVLSEVPDIFHAGHVHVLGAETYRGVLMVNSGTWQSKTPFQESVGVEPTAAHAILVNLKTHELSQRDCN